jgi:predicted transglutaminase-like cysteine proteinase
MGLDFRVSPMTAAARALSQATTSWRRHQHDSPAGFLSFRDRQGARCGEPYDLSLVARRTSHLYVTRWQEL